jgi:hypothetical protein
MSDQCEWVTGQGVGDYKVMASAVRYDVIDSCGVQHLSVQGTVAVAACQNIIGLGLLKTVVLLRDGGQIAKTLERQN